MYKIATFGLFIILLLNSGYFSQATSTLDITTQSFSKEITFSDPIIEVSENVTNILLEETLYHTTEPGQPQLPYYVEVFTMPFGTKIISVDCTFQASKWFSLENKPSYVVQPTIQNTLSEQQRANISVIESVSDTDACYPLQQYEYHLGSGIKNKEHVQYVVVHIYPVIYHASNQTISSVPSVHITVDYEAPTEPTLCSGTADTDLVIIAPESYKDALSPLVYHKKSIGTRTVFQPLDEITSTYPGRDQSEKIKYYIKDMIEQHGISYVLLVGDIYKVPIRTTNVSIFGNWVHPVLSDLYYADIYDGNGSFSSWDTDNDEVFGETGEDTVDLYPDVYLGRLPCSTVEEVSIIVDKIIVYEQNTFGQDWFHQMIFIGGNTFPNIFQPGNEGEKHNLLVMDMMDDFTPSAVIWTSEGNFHPWTINRAINKGAGFIDYSGHGFEHGLGTYKPHGRHLKTYLTPYVNGLRNGYELPIIFFDACLTAKLDFTLQDVLDYKQYRLFDIIARIMDYNTSIKLPCFAYSFLKHPNGGAIATIGATRTAFGDEDFGCEKLSLEFFDAYERGIQLGEMFAAAQTSYRYQIPTDEFTIEEFVLLGDPSLHVGGYSDDVEPPTLQLINPKPDRIHLRGIPVLPLNQIVVLGGFSWKPIQVEVADNVDKVEDIKVTVTVENKVDTRLEFNRFKGLYELEWDGFGLNRFTMNITAVDMSGNKASLEVPVLYICFHLRN